MKPTEGVAQERVLCALVTRAYEKLRSWIDDRYNDANSGHRLHKFGAPSWNNLQASYPSAVAAFGSRQMVRLCVVDSLGFN